MVLPNQVQLILLARLSQEISFPERNSFCSRCSFYCQIVMLLLGLCQKFRFAQVCARVILEHGTCQLAGFRT